MNRRKAPKEVRAYVNFCVKLGCNRDEVWEGIASSCAVFHTFIGPEGVDYFIQTLSLIQEAVEAGKINCKVENGVLELSIKDLMREFPRPTHDPAEALQ
jgi:hypothetical protein